MFFRIILKIYLVIVIKFYSFIALIKLSFIGKVGSNLRAEGPILLSAISGYLEIGSNVTIGPNVRFGIMKGAKLIIGNNVSINQGTFIVSVDSIIISDDCRIGEYCSIRDNDHEFKDVSVPIRTQGFSTSPIFIGCDVWLGRGVCVSKGVHIEHKSIVGANAVVTKNIPKFEVWAGVPAKKLKNRVINEVK